MSALVVVANRLPVQISAAGEATASPGGLASALSSVATEGSTWVGWAGPAAGRLAPLTLGDTRLHPIPLSPSEEIRYYQGFSNSVLWPLFHGRLRREEMNRSWWRTYRTVNERFASAVARTAPPNATVWVHDYHLLLVPKLLRVRRPDVRIGLFLHIPFPPAQLFSMLPWRQEVLSGMLGSDLIGFQVPEDATNFLGTVERLLELPADGHRLRVGARTIEVDAFPISVDFDRWDGLGDDAVESAASLRTELGALSIFLGIDRLDYTKGITQRLHAFEELLDEGRIDSEQCAFVQVAVPSRSDVPAYQDEREEVETIVERINDRHRRANGQGPVRYIESSFDDAGLAAWYRAADALVVTSLADGMNLVAKEFVAARGDGDGVVVLSEFAGAAQDFPEALIINPYDIEAIKSALLSALSMPDDERLSRMASMRDNVRSHDVHHWAQYFLERLATVPRQRHRFSIWNLPGLSRLAVAHRSPR